MLETTAIMAIVIGVTEVLKKTFNINTRFVPIISLALALFYVLLVSELPLAESVFIGLITGLSASGLYDVGKKTILKK